MPGFAEVLIFLEKVSEVHKTFLLTYLFARNTTIKEKKMVILESHSIVEFILGCRTLIQSNFKKEKKRQFATISKIYTKKKKYKKPQNPLEKLHIGGPFSVMVIGSHILHHPLHSQAHRLCVSEFSGSFLNCKKKMPFVGRRRNTTGGNNTGFVVAFVWAQHCFIYELAKNNKKKKTTNQVSKKQKSNKVEIAYNVATQ